MKKLVLMGIFMQGLYGTSWACTGFDRDSEDGEAIRRRCVKSRP